jgi:glycosyltransferase involved in cell wall biosynthesis
LQIPFIVSLHGSDIYVANQNWLFGKIARIVFKKAAKVTACSLNLASNAVKMGADDKVVVVPWGADPSIFSPALRDSEYRKTRGYPIDATIIIALGRMVHKKGFDQLIKIWPQIVAKHENAFLIIGGDGPIKKILEDHIREQNISGVSLPGKIPWNEVPFLLANSNVFVLPSIRDQHGNEDGLPTVLLEAMASGLPVVTSSIGGVPLVIKDYNNGILIDPGDTNQLLSAV